MPRLPSRLLLGTSIVALCSVALLMPTPALQDIRAEEPSTTTPEQKAKPPRKAPQELTRSSIADPAEDAPNTLTSAEQADGWLQLFDGETLFGWRETSDANWSVADGEIRVSSGKPGLLRTTTQFNDYKLRLEFASNATTNSGVFLRTPDNPTDPAKDCYEVNIAAPAVSMYSTGSLVLRQKAGTIKDNAHTWNKMEITIQGGRVKVSINKHQVLDYTDPKPLPANYIGLQMNHGPVRFRNIELKPLGLKPLFNGKDLSGWRTMADRPAKFSVTPEGDLHLVGGPGQLESEKPYGDFIAQVEVLPVKPEINSGLFFRCIPSDYLNGYECQINNAIKPGTANEPLDCGTGGIYRRQNARKIVAPKGEWLTLTLAANGLHYAAWVDGYQVTDWTDTRPANENPRKGSRLEPGTLALQGHDATTEARFRRIEIAEIPRAPAPPPKADAAAPKAETEPAKTAP